MEKKKICSHLLGPVGRYTGNNFFFKGGLTIQISKYFERIRCKLQPEVCHSEDPGGGGGGDFKSFYPDVWAGVSATHPLWHMPKTMKIRPIMVL